MKAAFARVGEKYDALTHRERLAVTLCIVAVIGMLNNLFLETQWSTHEVVSKHLTILEKDLDISEKQAAAYLQRLAADPNKNYLQRLSALQHQGQAVDAQLNASMEGMVPADEMPELLQSLLSEIGGIELIKFSSVAPVSLLAVGKEDELNLYRHGIHLSLTGDYFAVMRFVAAVETMPDKLYWQRFDYKVAEYPNAIIDIEFYTLSIYKDFISVAN